MAHHQYWPQESGPLRTDAGILEQVRGVGHITPAPGTRGKHWPSAGSVSGCGSSGGTDAAVPQPGARGNHWPSARRLSSNCSNAVAEDEGVEEPPEEERNRLSRALSQILRGRDGRSDVLLDREGWVYMDVLLREDSLNVGREKLLSVIHASNMQKLRYEVCSRDELRCAVRAIRAHERRRRGLPHREPRSSVSGCTTPAKAAASEESWLSSSWWEAALPSPANVQEEAGPKRSWWEATSPAPVEASARAESWPNWRCWEATSPEPLEAKGWEESWPSSSRWEEPWWSSDSWSTVSQRPSEAAASEDLWWSPDSWRAVSQGPAEAAASEDLWWRSNKWSAVSRGPPEATAWEERWWSSTWDAVWPQHWEAREGAQRSWQGASVTIGMTEAEAQTDGHPWDAVRDNAAQSAARPDAPVVGPIATVEAQEDGHPWVSVRDNASQSAARPDAPVASPTATAEAAVGTGVAQSVAGSAANSVASSAANSVASSTTSVAAGVEELPSSARSSGAPPPPPLPPERGDLELVYRLVDRILAAATAGWRSVLSLPECQALGPRQSSLEWPASLALAQKCYRNYMRLLHPDKLSPEVQAYVGRERCELALRIVQEAVAAARNEVGGQPYISPPKAPPRRPTAAETAAWPAAPPASPPAAAPPSPLNRPPQRSRDDLLHRLRSGLGPYLLSPLPFARLVIAD
mmetsp:Transcript_57696/g.124777  ORF Transcript_57696/g.124777 Transcript_57696/m.124777 type:complete len:692 (+) Transcript_57696:169-2244(+)